MNTPTETIQLNGRNKTKDKWVTVWIGPIFLFSKTGTTH